MNKVLVNVLVIIPAAETLVIGVVAISAVWVYLDATGRKIGKVPGTGGVLNMSAGAWGILTLFLWIIAFPAYLIKRRTLIQRAIDHPVVVKGRWFKALIIATIGGFLLLVPWMFSMYMAHDPNFYKDTGVYYAAVGDWDQAIHFCNKAIEINPDDPEVYLYRASFYTEQGNIERAIADCNKALEIDPRNAWAYSERGLAYDKKGQYDQAIADYAKALEINPLMAGFYVNRGNAWDDKGSLDRAIANYNKAIKLDPSLALAYIERGVAYSGSGDYERGIEDLNKAIELDPHDARAYKSRGNAFFYQGSFESAEADYQTCLKRNPKKDIYTMFLLYVAQERGRKSGLNDLSDNIKNVDVNKWPGPVANLFLGKISPEELLVETKDYDQRVEKERQCEAYFYLGQYYLLRNDKEKAAQMFRLCLETNVTNFVEYTGAKVELERMGMR